MRRKIITVTPETLANHLRAAADIYQQDCDKAAETAAKAPAASRPAYLSLAEQFERQREECLVLAEALEDRGVSALQRHISDAVFEVWNSSHFQADEFSSGLSTVRQRQAHEGRHQAAHVQGISRDDVLEEAARVCERLGEPPEGRERHRNGSHEEWASIKLEDAAEAIRALKSKPAQGKVSEPLVSAPTLNAEGQNSTIAEFPAIGSISGTDKAGLSAGLISSPSMSSFQAIALGAIEDLQLLGAMSSKFHGAETFRADAESYARKWAAKFDAIVTNTDTPSP